LGDDPSWHTTAQRGAELTTWAVVYVLLAWLSLAAALIGGAGEGPYYLAAGLTLMPLAIGFWFRWSWARWAGFAVFAGVAGWAVWQLAHRQVLLMSIALLLTSAETLWCLWRWPAPSDPPSGSADGPVDRD
jgi:hypothetical protein